jgi:ribosomal protein L11 methyltransferase
MPTYTALTTLAGDDAAEALAQALERMQPEPLEVEIYDEVETPGLARVVALFAKEPNGALLDVLAEAFGATPFSVTEHSQRTFTALTTLPGEAAAKALAEAIEAMEPPPYGVGAFEIEDDSGLWEVGSYFLDGPDAAMLDALAAAHGAKPFVVSELPEIDWVAKVRRELAPVDAGRFFVFGSHDAERAADLGPDRVALQIEATVAFGTGHHGTTLGCLRAFDRLFSEGLRPARVADIGCGTAVLAMAAAAVLPQARVLASDIDQVAVDVARANVAINGLEGRIECMEAAGFAHPHLAEAAPFDLVFANILKGPLIELAPPMAAHVRTGGLCILSGLLVVQADGVTTAYRDAGFESAGREDIGEWSTLVMRRI